MPRSAVVTFTARNLDQILQDGGSQAWRLDADRARRSEFLVCTQNRHNAGFGAPAVGHGHAFLIARISSVVPSTDRPDRWSIQFDEYLACDIPNIWAKSGPLRYPVWYTTLEELGINLDSLPPFQPLPVASAGSFLSESAAPILMPPREWTPTSAARRSLPLTGTVPGRTVTPDGQDAWAQLDAILGQLDRIPDLPNPVEALDWDEHGLPR